MSTKSGKYLKKIPKRKRTDKPVKSILTGIILIILAFTATMLCFMQNQSTYRMIVRNGYTGTQEQWLASLVGEETDSNAESAYELAVMNGYEGSESEWVEVLIGMPIENVNATPYKLACENGFEGSLAEWLTKIADKPNKLGLSSSGAQKTEYELACEYGYAGTFIEWLVSVTHDQVFD